MVEPDLQVSGGPFSNARLALLETEGEGGGGGGGWGPFLESPGNLSCPISVFGDKCFLTEVKFC